VEGSGREGSEDGVGGRRITSGDRGSGEDHRSAGSVRPVSAFPILWRSLTSLLYRGLPSASVDHALSALKTIGLLSCARDGSLAFTPPSTDPTSAAEPTCWICDAWAGSSTDDSTRTGGTRVFTDAPVTAMKTVARTLLDSETNPKVRLAFLKALPRLLRHSRAAAGALPLNGRDSLVTLVFAEADASTRTLRTAAG